MKKHIILLATLILSIFIVTGCSEKQEVINVYNWGDYIDTDIFAIFEEETGIKVNYETFATNEEMYAKIKQGGIAYDIAIPSDYMISKMISEDMLVELDKSKLSNYENIMDDYRNLEFDPDDKYSVPYFWGTVGIVYNTDVIKEEINSWDVLWDEKNSQRFTMIDSSRDTIMVALKKLGYSMNTRSVDELNEARDLLIEQKPLVKAYVGDTVKDMMLANEVDMAVVWSGEVGMILDSADNFAYAIPEEGSNYWFDNIVIPKTSANVDGAHKFIDFLCREDIGFMNTDYVGYSTCNSKVMEMLDDEILNTVYGYPELDKYHGLEVFLDPADFIEEYDRVWTEIKAY